MLRRLLWTLEFILLCLVYLSLALRHAADLPRTRVEIVRPGTGMVLLTVDAELATTPETRTRGLMERPAMPVDQGMLFIFEVAQPLSFWMFNTLIPLDIIFADAERRITSIYTSLPTTAALPHRHLTRSRPIRAGSECRYGGESSDWRRRGAALEAPLSSPCTAGVG